MNGEYWVDGDDKPTLHEAFEDAGMKAERQLESEGVAPDDVERRRFTATINVETQPHNQWIKAYRVRLDG
ncbi:MAG: hypothetical protein ACRDNY_12060 [Gaiellaceae bacterium]